jgi:DNA repair exonuclease SbcCD ATPase subunit
VTFSGQNRQPQALADLAGQVLKEELVFSLYALSLALLIPPASDQELPLSSPGDILNQPLVELLQMQSLEGFSASELKALRSSIEEERDRKIQQLKQLEQGWKKKLAASRNELQELNRQASEDTEEVALKRADLHREIASLERVINEKAIERERTIPTTYELQLAKIWLAEHWPERREEIRQQVESGDARERRHGDAEDIGYRRLVKNPEEDIPAGEQTARQTNCRTTTFSRTSARLPRESPQIPTSRFPCTSPSSTAKN